MIVMWQGTLSKIVASAMSLSGLRVPPIDKTHSSDADDAAHHTLIEIPAAEPAGPVAPEAQHPRVSPLLARRNRHLGPRPEVARDAVNELGAVGLQQAQEVCPALRHNADGLWADRDGLPAHSHPAVVLQREIVSAVDNYSHLHPLMSPNHAPATAAPPGSLQPQAQ